MERKMKIAKMNRKAQFYLLTAVFLSALVFLVADIPQKTAEGSKEPLYLYENFVSEAPRVINGAIYQERNITADFDDFSGKFIYHAGAKNINLSLFYVIVYGDEMVVSNKMGEEVTVTTSAGERVYASNEQLIAPKVSKMKVEIGGVSYPFSMERNITEFKLVFRTQDSKNNTEVYVYG